MKKVFLFLAIFLLALAFASCVKEFPEPIYTPETIAPEDRKKIGSEDANGISFDLYNDLTAEICGFDEEAYTKSELSLPEKYDRYKVIAIGENAFEEAPLLQITLPKTIERIGKGAFRRSTIREIEIPDSVIFLGEDAFDNCLFLEKAVIGKGLNEIPTGAFFSCRALKEISLSKGLLKIGEEAFGSLPNLQKIIFPSSLVEIGAFAFWGSGTDSISFQIPESVERIGQSAFRETPWLKAKEEEFVILGKGILIDYNGNNETVTLPDGILSLSDAFAFSEVRALKLNDDLVAIEENAFEETKISSLSYGGKSEEIRKIVKEF